MTQIRMQNNCHLSVYWYFYTTLILFQQKQLPLLEEHLCRNLKNLVEQSRFDFQDCIGLSWKLDGSCAKPILEVWNQPELATIVNYCMYNYSKGQTMYTYFVSFSFIRNFYFVFCSTLLHPNSLILLLVFKKKQKNSLIVKPLGNQNASNQLETHGHYPIIDTQVSPNPENISKI